MITQPDKKDGTQTDKNVTSGAMSAPSNADIMLFLKNLQQTLGNKIDNIETKLKTLDQLEVKVNSFEVEMNKMRADIRKIHDDQDCKIKEIDERLTGAEFANSETHDKILELESENQKLKDSLVYVQSQSMRNNLIFCNIEEEIVDGTEDMEEVLRKFMVEKIKIAQDIVDNIQIEGEHRMGRSHYNGGSPSTDPRKIVCKFAFYKDKENMRKRRSVLNKTPYFLYEQFPPEVVEKRKKLQPKLKSALDAGSKAWLVYDTLYIDGKPWKKEQVNAEDGLRVLVWNCNGLSENKIVNQCFLDKISNSDIAILLESWTDELSDIDLISHNCHNFYRKFKHKKARRNSGGIVVYVKHNISRYVSFEKNFLDTIIWIKVDKDLFCADNDVYICGVYAWPDNSPAANIHNINIFDQLQEDIYQYEQKGTVFLAGDFNARVGVKSDFIVCDKRLEDFDDIDYIADNPPSRASQDKTSNARGNKLLDLCKSTGYLLANGRLSHDSDDGSFTYYSRNSCSTIDYLLLEYHFILICNKYDDLRKQFIKKFYYKKPSMAKLISLLNVDRSSIINNLGMFLYLSSKRRNSLINSENHEIQG